MLEELRIQNLAVIDRLELRFEPGFNVITGETGAGKSILIDAVELLLGGRADPALVRAGSESSLIEGIIALDRRYGRGSCRYWNAKNCWMTPSRITSPSCGRYGGGGVPARASMASQCVVKSSARSGASFSISTARANISPLFRPRHHIDLLDRFANLLDTRFALGKLVAQLTSLQAEMRTLRDDRESMARRADLLRHELEEINAAELDAAEEADLQLERNRLANSEQLAQLVGEAALLLDGDESRERAAALDGLMGVAAALQKLARIDTALAEDYQLAEDLAQQAQELALNLGRYAAQVEYDPLRLDELEERLELIKTLKRRYRVDSIAEILAYGERAAAELERIDHSDERLQQLRLGKNASCEKLALSASV